MIKNFYNKFIRPYLPYKIAVCNGVPVDKKVKLFDFTYNFPSHEDNLIQAIHNHHSGSKACLIGGGFGVSSVIASRYFDTITVYEGSPKMYNITKRTLELSEVNNAKVLCYIIEKNVLVYDSISNNTLNTKYIDECDTLIMDCEGAEKYILPKLSYNPNLIMVETHEFLNSNFKTIKNILNTMEYEIIDTYNYDYIPDPPVIVAKYKGD